MDSPIDLQFQIPADVSFPEAIGLAQNILALPEDADDAIRAPAIAALVQTENGARGWFVSFLSGDATLADAPTAGTLRAMRSAPTVVADLMTKNLAMSTAMELTHRANGDLEQAAGSARVQARSRHLIAALNLPELQTELQALAATIAANGGQYQDFLDRWGYDDAQRQAIAAAVQAVL
ncbi:MAG: hypothetical protein RLZZ511_164 [Cyanobacteriota bacterium]|jgi:hypothetical protein